MSKLSEDIYSSFPANKKSTMNTDTNMHQTYLKDCNCEGGGIIIYEGKAVCRWCRKPYGEGAKMNYLPEHFIQFKSIPNKQEERNVVGCLKETRHHGIKEFWYEFVIIGKSAKDELPAIKNLLERYLNGEMDTDEWDSLVGKGISINSAEYKNMRAKKYTQSEVDTIRANVFKSLDSLKENIAPLTMNTLINEIIKAFNVITENKPTPTPQESKEGWEVLSCKWNGEVYDASELPKDDFRLKDFIFYVKRISDGRMFHVGQLHNGKTIEKFFIGWKGMEIHYTDGSGVLFTTEEPFLPKLPTPQGSKEGWEIVTAKSKNGDIHDFIPEGNKKGSVPCFKMEEPCKAFSVRRISDNKVFSVGEDVFYINDIKEILSWSIREDGMIYAEMLEDIFFPITRLNKVLNNSNPQGSKEGWEVLTWFSREGEVAVLVGGEIEGNLKAGYTIRSVRRNSDGEVFTVGDKIGWGTDGSYETTLTGFEIQDGRLKFNDSERPEYCKWADFLNAVNLHKKLPIKEAAPQGKPLFTTEELLEAEHKAFYAAREYSDGKWSNQFPPPKLGEAKHATFSDYKESQKLNQ